MTLLTFKLRAVTVRYSTIATTVILEQKFIFSQMYVKYYSLLLQMLSDFRYKGWKSYTV